MTWSVAKSLLILRQQIDTAHPTRSKASDGTIGDAAHASRSSDHNPWVQDGGQGVVTAMDITHDPDHGVDARALAEAIRASRDARVKYLISNAEICASYPAGGKPSWAWRPYTGVNAHKHHVHISVVEDKARYDSQVLWAIAAAPTPTPVLRKGDRSEDVARLQKALNAAGCGCGPADGDFGPKTEMALRVFQADRGLVVDGVAGPKVWAALKA